MERPSLFLLVLRLKSIMTDKLTPLRAHLRLYFVKLRVLQKRLLGVVVVYKCMANVGVWCEYHSVFHDPAVLEKFQKSDFGWEGCPIALLEKHPDVNFLDPSYTVMNKSCTEALWPHNADLLITKLPSTERNGYTRGLVGYVANRSYRSMNDNSLGYVVMSSFKEGKKRPLYVIDAFEEAGFEYIDIIVLKRNKFIPIQGNKRLNNVYDFMLMFSKGDNYHLDRSSIAYLRTGEDGEEYLCPGNLWDVRVDDKDSLSEGLVSDVISLSNLLPNSLVIDPFGGTGATLVSSLKARHSFWGCEPNIEKYRLLKKAIRDFRGEYT